MLKSATPAPMFRIKGTKLNFLALPSTLNTNKIPIAFIKSLRSLFVESR